MTPTAERPAVLFGEAMIELSDVEGARCRLGVAGDTYNTAVYMARRGVAVSYATALGDDPFSERILAALRRERIGVETVVRLPGQTPGVYAIEVDADGERRFTYWRSASAVRSFFKGDAAAEAIARMRAAPLLYLSGITLSLFDDEARARIASIAAAVRAAGGDVAFDTNYRPAGWPSPPAARDAVAAISPHVSIALPTFDDERALHGDETPETTAARWRDAGVEEVVVKHGAEGVFAARLGWRPPPAALRPVDTTGAGDSFNGAYLGVRSRGGSLEEAIAAGHDTAARVLMTPGAILPTD
ncbi:MAG: sugar kinase [Parvularculaceae bacterium]